MGEPKTLLEAIRYFSDPDVCQDFMVNMRWPDGVVRCPTCGRDDVRYISTRRLWECKDKHPKRQFSVKVGTIFEDSPIGLDKWLAAIWLIANAKNGVSSYELARSIGVTQKTAWFMLQRIRLAMQSDDFTKLDGIVETDETFVGGKARFMHRDRQHKAIDGRGPLGKTAVMGLLSRHGPDGHSTVRASVIPNVSKRTLGGKVRKHVEQGAELMSDAWAGYNGLEREYIRGVIDHTERYVDGKVHTNGIENFWTLLKRAIRGTYVNVEPFHLFRYVDEEVFRFNSRKAPDGARFRSLTANVTGKRLTYAELTTTPA
jgi:transposase-like protein